MDEFLYINFYLEKMINKIKKIDRQKKAIKLIYLKRLRPIDMDQI